MEQLRIGQTCLAICVQGYEQETRQVLLFLIADSSIPTWAGPDNINLLVSNAAVLVSLLGRMDLLLHFWESIPILVEGVRVAWERLMVESHCIDSKIKCACTGLMQSIVKPSIIR